MTFSSLNLRTGVKPVRSFIVLNKAPSSHKKIAVIGGGFTGVLFAIKLAAAQPDLEILLIERDLHAGRGVAYGACGPQHLLNVPALRMEVGLEPAFIDWLKGRPGLLRDALEESGGLLEDAFVPRQLFGDYMQARLGDVLKEQRIRRVDGEAVSLDAAKRQIILANGVAISIDAVVLATGNVASRLPFVKHDTARVINDPWQTGALERIGQSEAVLLVGTGLTMVDTVIALRARGHVGPLHAISRHGLLPRSHRRGGTWPAFLKAGVAPLQALGIVRRQVRLAEADGIPWQRVFDSVRPAVASLWEGWREKQRAQFLRHLRTFWDVHRHRMAHRISLAIDELRKAGVLQITAARVLALDEHRGGISVMVRPRGAKARILEVGKVINCTGPTTGLASGQHSFLVDLERKGLVRSDPLRLGIDTEDCAAIGADGIVSDWIFALGPSTKPAWWEITAVPEISAQVTRLVRRFDHAPADRPLAAIFLDIGAGI